MTPSFSLSDVCVDRCSPSPENDWVADKVGTHNLLETVALNEMMEGCWLCMEQWFAALCGVLYVACEGRALHLQQVNSHSAGRAVQTLHRQACIRPRGMPSHATKCITPALPMGKPSSFLCFSPARIPLRNHRTIPQQMRGSLKRSARAVQLFGRLAVLDTHTLRYWGPVGASW